MKSFEQIEHEFLEIESKDFQGQINFYNQNHGLISKNLDFKNQFTTEKSLWILSEIVQSFIYSKRNKEGIKLALKVKKWFELYSRKFNKDLSNDNFYKMILWTIAINYFDNNRFLKSYFAFNQLSLIDEQNLQIQDFKRVSFYRISRLIANISLSFAILIVILKIFMKSLTDTNYFESLFWQSIDLFLFAIYLTGFIVKKPKIIKEHKKTSS